MAIVAKITNYFKEAYEELQKVVWPSQKQTLRYSLIVIAIALSTAAFFALMDYIFRTLLTYII